MLFVYSSEDAVSIGVADELKSMLGMEHDMEIDGNMHFRQGEGIEMLEVGTSLVEADYVERLVNADFIVFLSKHRSAKGIPAFTVHSEGNWGDAAELGGRPNELGMAAPLQMARFLGALRDAAAEAGSDVPVVYEATHHGPLLKTPSFFAELGGNDEAMGSTALRSVLADAAERFVHDKGGPKPNGKIAIYIGGMHYARRATELAMGKGYAFAHIMPKYYVDRTGMLAQAASRSDGKPEIALIEWKSINADKRNKVTSKLEELGLDYERV
jgi:D-aminoacyl-tRNA deacylase